MGCVALASDVTASFVLISGYVWSGRHQRVGPPVGAPRLQRRRRRVRRPMTYWLIDACRRSPTLVVPTLSIPNYLSQSTFPRWQSDLGRLYLKRGDSLTAATPDVRGAFQSPEGGVGGGVDHTALAARRPSRPARPLLAHSIRSQKSFVLDGNDDESMSSQLTVHGPRPLRLSLYRVGRSKALKMRIWLYFDRRAESRSYKLYYYYYYSPWEVKISRAKNMKLKSKVGISRGSVLHRRKQSSRVLRPIWNAL